MRNRHTIDGDVTRIHVVRKDGSKYVVLIDTEDVDRLAGYSVCVAPKSDKLYPLASKEGIQVLLHRLLTDAVAGEGVDHIYGDTFDARKSQLNKGTHAENLDNRPALNSNSSSGIRGVSWNSTYNKWCATVKRVHLGLFDYISEAASAIDRYREKES